MFARLVMLAFEHRSDTKILFKESLQLFDNRLLLLCTISTAKSADRRHKLINIRADSLYFAFAECIF